MITLEEQLKITRNILNINKKELAQIFNVSETSIRNWEKGKTYIRRGMRPKVAQWLKDAQQEMLKQMLEKRNADIPWYEALLSKEFTPLDNPLAPFDKGEGSVPQSGEC